MVQAAAPLLSDPVRAVRVEAARALAGVDPNTMTAEQRTAFDSAYRELVAAEMVDADRPEAHLNLGLLHLRRQLPAEAEAEYRTALRLDRDFVPAMANLADLDRMRGQDQQGAELLRKALLVEPNNADVHHSLGLLLVRQRNYAEALGELRQASELAPGQCALCLCLRHRAEFHRRGRRCDGVAGTCAPAASGGSRTLLVALVSIARDRGDIATALRYARELSGQHPTDTQLRALVLGLERQQGR